VASNGEDVRKAALAELARRELARRQQQPAQPPGVGQQAARQGGLGVRMVAEGGMDIVSPFADAVGIGLNALTSGYNAVQRRVNPEGYDVTINGQKQHRSGQLPQLAQTQHSQNFSQMLTGAGLPEPQGGIEKGANIAGRIVTGMAAGGAIDDAVMGGLGYSTRAQQARQAQVAPTSEELKRLSQQAYQKAEDAGVVISPNSLADRVGKIVGEVAQEGIDPTLHPQATAALKRLTDAVQKGEPIALQQLETLRKIAKGAAGSLSADERRIARIMVDSLDDYALNLSTADVVAGNAEGAGALLQNARSLWSRASKGEVVDELVKRARDRSAQFSGSGYENALRTEFRNLVMNPKRLRLFTPVEQQALQKVARGGPIENTLRYFGKFAPTGVVSGALSSGIGAVAGGAPGAVALPIAGLGARQGATMLTARNARLASELMRRGAPAASASLSQAIAPAVPYALGAAPTLAQFLAQQQGRR
jgi:hypothetical protein